jgi:hypothetical protein
MSKDEDKELPVVEYLQDLARRLMHIPVMYGVDGYDVDRVAAIAREIKERDARDHDLAMEAKEER